MEQLGHTMRWEWLDPRGPGAAHRAAGAAGHAPPLVQPYFTRLADPAKPVDKVPPSLNSLEFYF